MKCKNCGHTVIKLFNQKDRIGRLFNGQWVHKNIGHSKWAVICRVKKCGCLKPEPIEREI